MYLNDINEFAKNLYGNLIPSHSTLDLSETAQKQVHWKRIFNDTECPFNLTIDFGLHPVPHRQIKHLMDGVELSQRAEGLSLCFLDAKSLDSQGINHLIHAMESNDIFTQGFSLFITAKNLENHAAFNQLIHAFFSPTSRYGKTLHLLGKLSNESHEHLNHVLSQKELPLGYSLHLSNPQDQTQEQLIRQKAQQSLRSYADRMNNTLNVLSGATFKKQLLREQLETVLKHIEKRLNILSRTPCYFDDFNLFKQCIKLNYLPASGHMTLDLNAVWATKNIEFRNFILRQLSYLIKQKPDALKLNIDFGKQSLEEMHSMELMAQLVSSKHSAKLKLSFKGEDSLGPRALLYLKEKLTSKPMTGLHLELAAENLEKYHLFNPFIHAITSAKCIAWLTLNFNRSTLLPEHISTILLALEKNQALGLWIDVGNNGTHEQRRIIHQYNRNSLNTSLPFISDVMTETTIMLKQRINEQLSAISPERERVSAEVDQHILKLQQASPSLSGKKSRITPLKSLIAMLLDPSSIESSYSIICNWETSTLNRSSPNRHLIESRKSILPRAASMNSTQIFIAQLKVECADSNQKADVACANMPVKKSMSSLSIMSNISL